MSKFVIINPNTRNIESLDQAEFNRYMPMALAGVLDWIISEARDMSVEKKHLEIHFFMQIALNRKLELMDQK